jgi:hypothetical protein
MRDGEPVGIRTRDPLIKSQMLYRLSYGLALSATEALLERAAAPCKQKPAAGPPFQARAMKIVNGWMSSSPRPWFMYREPMATTTPCFLFLITPLSS